MTEFKRVFVDTAPIIYYLENSPLYSEVIKRFFTTCIEKKLQEYKDSHNGKDFMCDVSTKTIEDICQLLQCQPQDLIEWKVDLNPELSYENRYKNAK